MPNLCFSVIASIAILVTISTLYSLWANRERISQDDLNDEDRAFIFRLTIFTIYPLVQFAGLKTLTTTCHFFGGYLQNTFYGLLWYSFTLTNLNVDQILSTFIVGLVAPIFIALIILPALLFRPHPYLATLIGYSSVFILFASLIVEPILSLLGLPSSLWRLTNELPANISSIIYVSISICALTLILTVRNEKVRLLFARLSRPKVTAQLKETISILEKNPNNMKLIASLSILYSQAGMPDKAQLQLNKLNSLNSDSVYFLFTFAYLSYFKRNFKEAQRSFTILADISIEPILKASFLSASAIAAIAHRDLEAALNASDRALEFDDTSSIARMVKVDVFMQKGRKKAAQEEILLALKKGLDVNIESKIPLDFEMALALIEKQEQTQKRPVRHIYSKIQ